MPFIPHTPNDIQEMLKTIGISNIEDLFDEIPHALRVDTSSLSLPNALTEMELTRLMKDRASENKQGLCFIGAGAYDHHIPSAVFDIASRGEFMTAYTPYQPEASQGTLQLLYEYQTMMASLMALDVSNASLYEGASALAEAILMSMRQSRKPQQHRILIPNTLHPHYRQVIRTIVGQQSVEFIDIPFDLTTGKIDLTFLEGLGNQKFTALIIPQPNFFGVIDDVDTLTQWAHAHQALAIAVVNPLAMALLKPPGQWGDQGADIACGEGQPLGIPLASGGPYYGFLCCKKELVRQMPGRIVGRTTDTSGKPGFVLTLQAREQHIRRAKATSNICTNQGWLVTASTIYMSLLGPHGLRRVALDCHQKLQTLTELLLKIPGVQRVFASSTFHEAVFRFPIPIEPLLQSLGVSNIQGGYSLHRHFPELGHSLLICTTETKTLKDLETFQTALTASLHLEKSQTTCQL